MSMTRAPRVASKVEDIVPPISCQVPVRLMLALVIIFPHAVQDFIRLQSTHAQEGGL